MQATTYHPNKRKRLTTHGFRTRMSSKDGREVLSRRRAKNRVKMTVSDEGKKYVAHHHAPFKRKIKNLNRNQKSSQAGD